MAVADAMHQLGWMKWREHTQKSISMLVTDKAWAAVDELADTHPKRTEEERRIETAKQRSATRQILRRIDNLNDERSPYRPKCGRVQHVMNSLPKLVRGKLRIFWQEESEGLAEVDISCSFFTAAATWVPEGEERDRIVSDLQSGAIYAELTKEAGLEVEDARRVKKDFNRCIFFDDFGNGFGLSALYRALESLYPALAREIMRRRKRHFGAKRLYHELARLEATVVVDGLMSFLADVHIPAIPLGDAVLVPASTAEKVRLHLIRLAAETLGFEPVVKVKGCPEPAGERVQRRLPDELVNVPAPDMSTAHRLKQHRMAKRLARQRENALSKTRKLPS